MVLAIGQKDGASSFTPLQRAAKEFEAMLIQDLLKLSDEESSSQGELAAGSEQYQELRNQAVATAMARNGGIGIANMLVSQLGRQERH